MNRSRATEEGYVQFLTGSPRAVSATEAARAQPAGSLAPAHDSFARLLQRLEPDAATLWAEVEPLIRPTDGGAGDGRLDARQAASRADRSGRLALVGLQAADLSPNEYSAR